MITHHRTLSATVAAVALAAALVPAASAAPTSDTGADAASVASDDRLDFTERRIGTAWFPASVWSVKNSVNPTFGWSDETSTDRVDGCLSDVTGSTHYYSAIFWNDGVVVRGVSQTKPVRLDSYGVFTAAASRQIDLPYKVGVGNSTTYLKARAGWMRVDDSSVFNDGRIYSRGKVFWFMNKAGTRVDEVWFNPTFCD